MSKSTEPDLVRRRYSDKTFDLNEPRIKRELLTDLVVINRDYGQGELEFLASRCNRLEETLTNLLMLVPNRIVKDLLKNEGYESLTPPERNSKK